MNKGSIWGLRGSGWRLRAGLFGLLVATSSVAADAGSAGNASPDGAVSCVTSASCGFPAPYCSPTLHTCVECTSDKNCTTGLVCDVARGACRSCNSDADCSSSRPYCDGATHACVECFTDANCGPAGEKCAAGKCGSCGDAICGRDERIEYFADPTDPQSGDTVACPEDCQKLCPASDLKSAIGKDLLSGSFAGKHRLFDNCFTGGDAPDLPVSWTAPHTGDFFVSSRGSSLSVEEWVGDCAHPGSIDCTDISPGVATGFHFMEGDTVTFIFRPLGDPAGTYSISISDQAPLCDSGPCAVAIDMPPPTPTTQTDAAALSAAAALCMSNARARHDDICAGTECACAHCPQDYDDCAVIPGCSAVSTCMTQKGCDGTDCYVSGACRAAIDTYGGLSGPAFRAASGLQSCALSLQCDLPCSDGGSHRETSDGGALDAGRVCAPHREVACPCEGGVTGTKECLADGSGFRPCVCEEPPLTPISSGGCDCRVGKGTSAGDAALAVLGVAIALSSRRRLGKRRPRVEGT